MQALSPAAVALLIQMLCTGCATSFATRQTARTLEPGQFSVDAATGAEIPLGTIAQVSGAGVTQVVKLLEAVHSGTPYTVTDQDKRDLVGAAVTLLLYPPSVVSEVGGRAGVLPNLDLGIRYSINALRGDVKYRLFQVVRTESRLDVAVGLSVSRYLFANPAFEVLEFVRLGDFSRWDLDVPVYISLEWGDWLRLYGAGKYIYSRTELDERLAAAGDAATILSGIDFQFSRDVHTHFIGATGGVKVGYKWVFVVAELTAGYALGSVHVLGEDLSLSGPILFPSIGVDVQF